MFTWKLSRAGEAVVNTHVFTWHVNSHVCQVVLIKKYGTKVDFDDFAKTESETQFHLRYGGASSFCTAIDIIP